MSDSDKTILIEAGKDVAVYTMLRIILKHENILFTEACGSSGWVLEVNVGHSPRLAEIVQQWNSAVPSALRAIDRGVQRAKDE